MRALVLGLALVPGMAFGLEPAFRAIDADMQAQLDAQLAQLSDSDPDVRLMSALANCLIYGHAGAASVAHFTQAGWTAAANAEGLTTLTAPGQSELWAELSADARSCSVVSTAVSGEYHEAAGQAALPVAMTLDGGGPTTAKGCTILALSDAKDKIFMTVELDAATAAEPCVSETSMRATYRLPQP